MKTLSFICAVALLAGCFSMGWDTSGGARGRSGGSIMSGTDQSSVPYSQRELEPNDLYFGD